MCERVRAASLPEEPRTVAEVPLLQLNTLSGEQFCKFDSGPENAENRFIIFTCDHNLRLMAQHRHWGMDGTFKVTPSQFYQIFIFHIILPAIGSSRHSLPMVYVLMKNKTQASYEAVMNALRNIAPEPLDPESCIADFEQASRLAFTTVFGDNKIVGCFFHLTQSVMRKIQTTGLSLKFNNHERSRTVMKCMCSLAFVPLHEVRNAFLRLLRDLDDNHGEYGMEYMAIRGLFQYFWNTYVCETAIFPINQWNQVSRVRQNLPRSDASLEGFHRGIRDCWGVHSRLYIVMEKMVAEQHQVEIQWRRYQAGLPLRRRSSRKWSILTHNLEVAVSDYRGLLNVTFYLRRVSHLFTLAKGDLLNIPTQE